MTYQETLREARRLERRGLWSAASDAWKRAAKMHADEHHELRPGDELHHVKRGVVRAVAVYRGPAAVEYAGKVYESLTAAAKAATADLGMAYRSGLRFWGLRKQESPTFTAQPDRCL